MMANPLVVQHLEQDENINPNIINIRSTKRGGKSSLESTLKKPISGSHSGQGGRNCSGCHIHKLQPARGKFTFNGRRNSISTTTKRAKNMSKVHF